MPNQCKRMLSDNVQCDGLVTSNITGEYCTPCYFKLKKENSLTALTERIVNPPNLEIETQRDGIEVTVNTNTKNGFEKHPETIKEEIEGNREIPTVSKGIEVPQDGKKYCQSCIERGYGLKLATREWSKDYFICDDCFEPLINSLVNYDATRAQVERVKNIASSNEPFLNQFYEILNIPVPLRFTRSEEILQLKNRNDIFVHHAGALVNKNLEEIKEQIENYQVMLFQIKIGLEPLTDYINKIKAEERTKANIEGVKKSKAEVTKTKMSKEEKEAKALGMSVERYKEMVKKAKEREFDKIVGKKDDDNNAAPMIK